jgi:hypothetical protein
LWQLEQQQKEWLAQQPSQLDTDATTSTSDNAKDDKELAAVMDRSDADNNQEVMPDISDEIMEKANRGQLPAMIKPQSKSTTNGNKGPIDLNAKKLRNGSVGKKNNKNAGKKRR